MYTQSKADPESPGFTWPCVGFCSEHHRVEVANRRGCFMLCPALWRVLNGAAGLEDLNEVGTGLQLWLESITCYLVISSGWARRWWLPQNTWNSSVFLFHKELRAVPLQVATRLPWTDCRSWSPCRCLLRTLWFCFESLVCTGACKMSSWVSAAVEPYQGDSFYSFFFA